MEGVDSRGLRGALAQVGRKSQERVITAFGMNAHSCRVIPHPPGDMVCFREAEDERPEPYSLHDAANSDDLRPDRGDSICESLWMRKILSHAGCILHANRSWL